MTPSILLLDCTAELEEKLKKLGFDAESGTVGFFNGETKLPSQVYEKDIFIYDPPLIETNEDDVRRIILYPTEKTPQFPIANISQHIMRGAILLSFIKSLSDYQSEIKLAYAWIPGVPTIEPTFDKKIQTLSPGIEEYTLLQPILSDQYVKLPVLQKLIPSVQAQGLYFNKNRDKLGIIIRYGKGIVILLPNCKSNEQIVLNFLHQVIPKILDEESGTRLIEKFLSPEEESLIKKFERIERNIRGMEEERDSMKQNIATANRNKVKTIKQDETAVLVLNYYDLAVQQNDVALFYIYKIIEAIERKYGGENQAKDVLRNREGWNRIGKLANSSYADVRHAPQPGEKVKQWTDQEIKECFVDAELIIHSYLKTLF